MATRDRKDVALENLDRGFQESKNIQILQFLNDQSEISSRLKTCRFRENTSDGHSNEVRSTTAPESATRTYRLRPLSARPSTGKGKRFEHSESDSDFSDLAFETESVIGRQRSARRRSSEESSLSQRPETVCGFYDLGDVEEEEEPNEIESDLDVLSVESITSTGPYDDIDDDYDDGVTYEFDVPESDSCHVEPDTATIAGRKLDSLSPEPMMSPPPRIKSSKHRTSITSLGKETNLPMNNNSISEPHPPPSRVMMKDNLRTEPNSTSRVLRHMRAHSSTSDLKERTKLHSWLSKGSVWGESGASSQAPFRPQTDKSTLGTAPMSPRISFEEMPIEKQGVKLRTVARIDCDASFYRKLRHRSAPAIRTEEFSTPALQTKSLKPVGIYHLPPLSKETTLQT